MKKLLFISVCSAMFLASCTSSSVDEMNTIDTTANKNVEGKSGLENHLKSVKQLPSAFINDVNIEFEGVVEPSECGPTAFNDAYNASVSSNLDDLGAYWYPNYADLNFYYSLTDESKPYFGENGQYTNFVNKRTRELEKFWGMPDEVSVRGQHNSTLNDKEKIRETLVFWYGMPEALAQAYADEFVDYVNVNSTFLIESPLVSFDGFAIALDGLFGQGDLIVIGDGIIEIMTDAGVEDKIVWTGIMAHEWAHQIQFNNEAIWYPNGAADNTPEATRTTELEADFFAAFYMTHKRGATYNWKRVEGFLELFFNIGDCAFTSSGHHGTPLQRMEASRLGYELAKSAKKNGHILSADEVHEAFSSLLGSIVE